jgi:hypothetical protein
MWRAGGGDGVISSSARLGPEGGTLVLGELRVDVPPGALSEARELTARRRPTPLGALGPWFELGPSGLRFARPIEISIRASDSFAAEHPAVFTATGDELLALLPPRTVDGRVLGTVSHLSPFGLAELHWPFAESPGDSVEHNGVSVAAPGASGIWLVALAGQVTVATQAPVTGTVHLAGLPPNAAWVLYRAPSHDPVPSSLTPPATPRLTVAAPRGL